MSIRELLAAKKRLARLPGVSQRRKYAELCSELGDVFRKKKNYDEAAEQFEEEAEVYDELGCYKECALAHRCVGEVYSSAAKFEEALKAQLEYLRYAERMDQDDGRTVEVQRARTMIGQVHIDRADVSLEKSDKKRVTPLYAPEVMADLKKAKKEIEASMIYIERLRAEQYDEKETATMECRAWTNMGIIFMHLGQHKKLKGRDFSYLMDEAVNCLMKAKLKAEEYALGDDRFRVVRNLIEVHYRRGQYREALQWADKIDISGEIRLATFEIYKEWKPRLNILVGRYDEAKNGFLKTAFAITSKVRDLTKPLKRKDYVDLCDKLDAISRIDKNLKKLIGAGPVDSRIYEELGDDCCVFSAFKRAEEFYKRAVEARSAEGKDLSTLFYSLGQTYEDLFEYNESLKFYELELGCFRADDDWGQKATTYNRIATVMNLDERDMNTVSGMFDKALEAAEKARRVLTQHTILTDYAEVLTSRGFEEEAKNKRELANILQNEGLPDSEEALTETEGECREGTHADLARALYKFPDDVWKNFNPCPQGTASGATWLGKPIKVNEAGESDLHTAAKKGDVNEVKKFLDMRYPVDLVDLAGFSALHDAAYEGHTEIVKMLCDHKADVNLVGGSEEATPLIEAAYAGRSGAVKVLLEAGADPWLKDNGGLTAWEVFWKCCGKSEERLEISTMLEEAMLPAVLDGTRMMPPRPAPETAKTDDDSNETSRPSRSKNRKGVVAGVGAYQDAIKRIGRSGADGGAREVTVISPVGDLPNRNIVALDDADEDEGFFRSRGRNRRPVSRSPEQDDDLDGFLVNDSREPPVKKKKTNDGASGSSSVRSLARRRLPASRTVTTQPSARSKENWPPVASHNSPFPASQPVSRFARSAVPLSPVASSSTLLPPTDLWVSPRSTFDDRHVLPAATHSRFNAYEPSVPAAAPPPPPLPVQQPETRQKEYVSVAFQDKVIPLRLNDQETFREFLGRAIKLYEANFGSKPVVSHLLGPNNLVLPLDERARDYIGEGEQLAAQMTHIDAAFDLKAKFGVEVPDWKVSAGILELVGRSLDAPAVTLLEDALGNFARITELKLGKNSLGDDFVTLLERCEDKLTSVTVLDVSCNGLTCVGIRRMAQHLSARPSALRSLEQLNISFNPLTDAAAEGLACIVEHCPNLKCFLGRHCGFTSAMFRSSKLRDTLSKSAVSEVDLSDNAILCDELFDCFSGDAVQRLVLDRIARAGMNVGILTRGLKKLLEKAWNLKSLSIMANGVSDQALKPLYRLSSPVAKGFDLNLSGNALTPNGLARILDIIGPIVRSLSCATLPISDCLEKKDFLSSSCSAGSSGVSSSSASAVVPLSVLMLARAMDKCPNCQVSLPRMTLHARSSFDAALAEAGAESRTVIQQDVYSVVLPYRSS